MKKSIIIMILAVFLGVLISGFSTEAASKNVNLKKSSATLEIKTTGKKTTYETTTIKVTSKNGVKIQKISYKNENKNKKIAVVDKKGKVTAKKAGSTKITVSVKYTQGKKKYTKKLTFKVNVITKNSQKNTSAAGLYTTDGIGNNYKLIYTWRELLNKEYLTVKKGTITNCNPKKISGMLIISPEVKKIGKNAFMKCTKLTSVKFPSSIKSIENSSFYGCKNLVSVFIPGSVATIGNQVCQRQTID